jgi:hypothetical protein
VPKIPISPETIHKWDQANADAQVGMDQMLDFVAESRADGMSDLELVAGVIYASTGRKQSANAARRQAKDVAAMLGIALVRLLDAREPNPPEVV